MIQKDPMCGMPIDADTAEFKAASGVERTTSAMSNTGVPFWTTQR